MEGAATVKSGTYTNQIVLPQGTKEMDSIYGIYEGGRKTLTIDLDKGTFSATSLYYYENESSSYVILDFKDLDISLGGTIQFEEGVGLATITSGTYSYRHKDSYEAPEQSEKRQNLTGSFRVVPEAHNIVQVVDFKSADGIERVLNAFDGQKLQLGQGV